MNYHNQPLFFKIKKVLRYVLLYGLRRTLIKVRGQYHMRRKFLSLPAQRPYLYNPSCTQVAIVGCGNFAFSNIAFYLSLHPGVQLRGVMDVDIHKAASLFVRYRAQFYTDDIDRLVDDSSIDIVYIASNHASHSLYAEKFIKVGKRVHVEKPHVVSSAQLDSLFDVISCQPFANIFLGFNRTRSSLFKILQSHLNQQSGPLMINWFIAGHEIPDDHWYFDEKEGGRVLGNLCHWTDLTLHLVGLDNAFPCTVKSSSPKGAKSDFIFSVVFADRSCATFTFSAKGHTFEGVREVLNIHKGNLLGNMSDFQELTLDIVDKRIHKSLLFRDHGHKANIINSLLASSGEDLDYVYLTAKFFLAFKKALDTNEQVLVS